MVNAVSAGSGGRVKAAFRGLFTVLLMLVAGGCTSLLGSRESDPARVFWLAQPEVSIRRLDPGGASILVGRPGAAPGFSGAQMLYSDTPYELESFALHQWADTPANMLEPLVVAALESSGLFSQVAPAATRARTDLRLDTELLRLLQVFSGAGSRVEVALRASLVDLADGRLVDTRVLQAHEPAAEPAPYAGVEAANRAVNRLLGDLKRFIAGSLKNR